MTTEEKKEKKTTVNIGCTSALILIKFYDHRQWCRMYMVERKPNLPEKRRISGVHTKFDRHNQYKAATSQMCV